MFFRQSEVLRETALHEPLPVAFSFGMGKPTAGPCREWGWVGGTYSGVLAGRGVAEEIDARVRLDERDLDAVERSGVGEDNSAFREIQRVRCEEFDPISRSRRDDVVCQSATSNVRWLTPSPLLSMNLAIVLWGSSEATRLSVALPR